jgi:hypothetical protein
VCLGCTKVWEGERKEGGRKKERKDGRKDGRMEGRKEGRSV